MRARWEGVHSALLRSVSTLKAYNQFKQARAFGGELSRFANPEALIGYFLSDVGEGAEKLQALDEKDRMLAALVVAVQSRSEWSELATAILWLGLWPGLDGIFRRRLRHFKEEPENLVARLSAAFITLVGEVDLKQVHRMAATLVKSTERNLMDGCRREWVAEGSRQAPSENEDRTSILEKGVPRRESEFGIPGGLSLDGEVAVLRARLFPIAGVDTDLFMVVVLEGNQREAANSYGLSHEVVRKRVQKIRRRLREEFENDRSQFSRETRV